MSCLHVLGTRQLPSPRVSDKREEKTKMAATMLHNFILEVTNHHLYHFLLGDWPCMGGTSWGSECQGWSPLGASWRLATISGLIPVPSSEGHLIFAKFRHMQPQKEGICAIWKMRPKEGEAVRTEQGGQSPGLPREKASHSVHCPARPQWPHLDNEGQLDQRSPTGGPRTMVVRRPW